MFFCVCAVASICHMMLHVEEVHFSIIREVVIPKSEKKCTLCGGSGHVASECTGQCLLRNPMCNYMCT